MISREDHHEFWGIVQHSWNPLPPAAELNRRLGNAYFDARISGAAALFTLDNVSDDAYEQAMENLAAAAEEHGIDVDDIKHLMEMHEKRLAHRTKQSPLLSDSDFED